MYHETSTDTLSGCATGETVPQTEGADRSQLRGIETISRDDSGASRKTLKEGNVGSKPIMFVNETSWEIPKEGNAKWTAIIVAFRPQRDLGQSKNLHCAKATKRKESPKPT